MTEFAPYDPANVLAPWLGKTCDEILRREHDWTFQFGDAGAVVASCPWRILAEGRIAHADEDDGQKFGLPKPVDGVERATTLLSGGRIVSIEVSPVSGDLKVHFERNRTLELFNNSSGYEAWQAVVKQDGKTANMVAQGGGQISMWNG
jgi:hypothetical protein